MERMFCSRYLGVAIVDKYYNPSFQKAIIIIIFPTRSTAWPLLSVHQSIAPSIFPFYNSRAVQTAYLCPEYVARPAGLAVTLYDPQVEIGRGTHNHPENLTLGRIPLSCSATSVGRDGST